MWRHFPRQKPLKSKNNNKKKHTIVWNTKFFHPVKFELKRMKTVKLFPDCNFRGKAGPAWQQVIFV